MNTKSSKPTKSLSRKRHVAARALPLFVRMGYEKVSFQDISEATGVPRTALYRYYRTKRQIFDAAIMEVIGEVRAEIVKSSEKGKTPTERLRYVSETILDLLYRRRDFVQVIFDFVFAKIASGEDMAKRVAAFTIGLKLTFRELVVACQAVDEIKRETDPDMLAELLFSMVESAGLKMLLGSEKTPAKAKARIFAAIDSILKDMVNK